MNSVLTWHGQPCDQRTIVCEMAIPVEPPDWILIVPWGHVTSTGEGGDYIVDAEAAREVLASFSARQGTPLVIDYEHASEGGEYASPSGVAPAMGWIRELKAVPGEGIYGRVEWTEPGANYVRSKQYRFLSPAGWIRKSDLRLVSIKSVALVNQPGIVGMRPIVNSAARGTGDRARAIAKAGAEFDANKERLSRISSGKEAYVNGSLLAAGQARLTRGEAAGLVAAEPGRSAVIANAAAEWEANKNGSLRLCGKDAWVNGALRQAGHTLLNKWEAVACKGGRDLHGYEVRLSINSDAAQSGRDNVIEKAVDDWKADKALQGVIDMEAFVQDALDQANLGKMTRQDRRTMAIVSNIAAKGIAESAGKTWDGDQAIQRLMTRDEYIDAALQEGGIDDVSKT